MFRRVWFIVVIVSVLWLSQSAIAEPRDEQDMSIQAATVGLPDAAADRVLGQAAFNTNSVGTSATTMNGPSGIAIAPPGVPNAGRLFVVEYANHRVLSWPSAGSFVTGQAADLVIGQANFVSGGGALGQNRFYGPEAAVVDSSGRLWVADTENNRMLRFDPPFSNGMNASLVLGQSNYISNATNQGRGTAANTLYYPRGLAIDAVGNLYVADDDNHRVLRFSPPFANNMNASLVIGQADFTSGNPNRGGAAGENTLNHPKGIAVDDAGNLYVAEYDNNRVLRFAPPLSNGKNASGVYGQPNYTSLTPNNPVIGPASLYHPVDIAVSAARDKMFVTDQGNVRVLGYSNPLGNAVADQVYGQPNFTSSTPNNGGVSATSINYEPLGVAVDAGGNLYHADFRNHRLLVYDTDMVGDGTPGSCTEAALNTALAGGGTITFSCGPAPHMIVITSQKSVNVNTTIDGGGEITLDGQNAHRLFDVGASLTLRNIVLTRGYFNGDGGAIRNNSNGRVVLENSTIRDSTATFSGGAILSTGPLTITNSLLEGNQALNGGALYPRFSAARTMIVNSVLRNNRATDTTNGWGGAILAWDGALVTIQGSDIYSNSARYGGGIYNFANSVLTLGSNTLLRNNIATIVGGGLYNAGTATLSDATLNSNSAYDGGGLFNDGVDSTASLSDVTLNGNSANSGGSLYNNLGTATLTNTTFSGNSANSGGSLYNNLGTATLTNATLSGNTAGISGGGIYRYGGSVTVKNTIVANSSFGGNCTGGVTNNGFNFSSDNTCGFGVGPDNVNVMLGPLANNGGPTETHMPQPGSPAIDDVAVGCPPPSKDQRGAMRPVDGDGVGGALCDAGAVEYEAFLLRVYVPVILFNSVRLVAEPRASPTRPTAARPSPMPRRAQHGACPAGRGACHEMACAVGRPHGFVGRAMSFYSFHASNAGPGEHVPQAEWQTSPGARR